MTKFDLACTCPRPDDAKTDMDFFRWVIWHSKTCKPRRIVDVYLPEMEGDDD